MSLSVSFMGNCPTLGTASSAISAWLRISAKNAQLTLYRPLRQIRISHHSSHSLPRLLPHRVLSPPSKRPPHLLPSLLPQGISLLVYVVSTTTFLDSSRNSVDAMFPLTTQNASFAHVTICLTRSRHARGVRARATTSAITRSTALTRVSLCWLAFEIASTRNFGNVLLACGHAA